MEKNKSKISFYIDELIGSISSHSKSSKQKFSIQSCNRLHQGPRQRRNVTQQNDFEGPFFLSCIFIFRNENWMKKSARLSEQLVSPGLPGIQVARRLVVMMSTHHFVCQLHCCFVKRNIILYFFQFFLKCLAKATTKWKRLGSILILIACLRNKKKLNKEEDKMRKD